MKTGQLVMPNLQELEESGADVPSFLRQGADYFSYQMPSTVSVGNTAPAYIDKPEF